MESEKFNSHQQKEKQYEGSSIKKENERNRKKHKGHRRNRKKGVRKVDFEKEIKEVKK